MRGWCRSGAARQGVQASPRVATRGSRVNREPSLTARFSYGNVGVVGGAVRGVGEDCGRARRWKVLWCGWVGAVPGPAEGSASGGAGRGAGPGARTAATPTVFMGAVLLWVSTTGTGSTAGNGGERSITLNGRLKPRPPPRKQTPLPPPSGQPPCRSHGQGYGLSGGPFDAAVAVGRGSPPTRPRPPAPPPSPKLCGCFGPVPPARRCPRPPHSPPPFLPPVPPTVLRTVRCEVEHGSSWRRGRRLPTYIWWEPRELQ